MTTLLQKAFAEAAKLPQAEQDVLAWRLLVELATEGEFDCASRPQPESSSHWHWRRLPTIDL